MKIIDFLRNKLSTKSTIPDAKLTPLYFQFGEFWLRERGRMFQKRMNSKQLQVSQGRIYPKDWEGGGNRICREGGDNVLFITLDPKDLLTITFLNSLA